MAQGHLRCVRGARCAWPVSLVLYDVSTLYFETDVGDGFREPGYSKERRLEPQITIGLLTDASGFPLALEAFEGNKAETATMAPTLQTFMAAHRLTDITVVADGGMLSGSSSAAGSDTSLTSSTNGASKTPTRISPTGSR